MRYHLYLVRDIPSEAPEFTPVATIDSETPNPSLETLLKSEVLTAAQRALAIANPTLPMGAPENALPRGRAGRGRRAKPVSIRYIDPEQEGFVSLRVGEIVQSSMELSLLLGYSYNMVSQVYSLAAKKKAERLDKMEDRAERKREESEPLEVTLRGVTFCYVEELAKREV